MESKIKHVYLNCYRESAKTLPDGSFGKSKEKLEQNTRRWKKETR
jgi:hypothetical protein